ncbi:MBL fold metallo-hydrolase [Elizabethkingia anophelis]|nr:MBL fold metallo-hydrolase [Elizabethkingia anophelis]
MKLMVLGSNSAGNCYIIQDENEALILEAGIKFSEVLKGLNFNISKVAACIITHEHGDHFNFVNDFLGRNIPTYASKGTWEAKNIKSDNILEAGKLVSLGGFKVLPFKVKHDCAEPVGFFINHPKIGNLVFATDTYYLPNRFANVNHWLIECNYRKDILDYKTPEGFNKILRDRTLQSHMSYDTCISALKANDLTMCKNIVLIHLSDRNSNAKEFREGVVRNFGKPTYIAQKGLEINLTEIPF